MYKWGIYQQWFSYYICNIKETYCQNYAINKETFLLNLTDPNPSQVYKPVAGIKRLGGKSKYKLFTCDVIIFILNQLNANNLW